MTDEEQKIYDQFRLQFILGLDDDKRIGTLRAKNGVGMASYDDAWNYARAVGEKATEAFNEVSEAIRLSEDGYDIVMNGLYDVYEQAAEYTASVQTLQNRSAGIGLSGVQADFNKSRASGIAHLASNAEDEEEAKRALEHAQHFTENVVGDTIKANEEFQSRSGLRPKIRRIAVGGCCEWCEQVAGEYEYPAPDEIYRRHKNCDCLVEYYPGNGLKQNAHTKQWSTEPRRRTDFFAGSNGKTLKAEHENWIGTNMMDEYLSAVSSKEAIKYIRADLRRSSFIGDGSTAAIREFEIATGLNCGRNGNSHIQKVEDLKRQLDKALSAELPEEDRAILQEFKKRLQEVST